MFAFDSRPEPVGFLDFGITLALQLRQSLLSRSFLCLRKSFLESFNSPVQTLALVGEFTRDMLDLLLQTVPLEIGFRKFGFELCAQFLKDLAAHRALGAL